MSDYIKTANGGIIILPPKRNRTFSLRNGTMTWIDSNGQTHVFTFGPEDELWTRQRDGSMYGVKGLNRGGSRRPAGLEVTPWFQNSLLDTSNGGVDFDTFEREDSGIDEGEILEEYGGDAQEDWSPIDDYESEGTCLFDGDSIPGDDSNSGGSPAPIDAPMGNLDLYMSSLFDEDDEELIAALEAVGLEPNDVFKDEFDDESSASA